MHLTKQAQGQGFPAQNQHYMLVRTFSLLHFPLTAWLSGLGWQYWLTVSLRSFHNKLSSPLSYYLPWKLIGQLHFNCILYIRSSFLPSFLSFLFLPSFLFTLHCSPCKNPRIPLRPSFFLFSPLSMYRKRDTISSSPTCEVLMMIGNVSVFWVFHSP